ncbi:MAG TPA: YciI family protein, partial [Actinomycetota bacterium]|nr:YciI family protein [Actinomycetota bacterium]
MASLQVCFLVTASYAENAEQARAPHREKHLERLSKLSTEGALLFAGAADDLSASVLVFAVENDEAVKAIVETDIYMRNGIWTDFTVTKL